MGYIPQESLENTINTMGTLLGVQPIVAWRLQPQKKYKTLGPSHPSLYFCLVETWQQNGGLVDGWNEALDVQGGPQEVINDPNKWPKIDG